MFKPRRNKISILSFILVISLLLVSCGGMETDQSKLTEQEIINVVDSLGREVEIPKDVDNIAALYSFSGYVCSILGRGNDMVAVPGGLPRDVLLTEIYPEIKDAAVPRSGGSINIEELMNANPDLIIVRGDMVADEAEQEKLDKVGIPYIVIDFETIGDQQNAIKIIGKSIGRENQAEEFLAYYDDVLKRVDDFVSEIDEEERALVYHSTNQALRTTHEDTLAADWSRKAGLNNVALGKDLEASGTDHYANIEQILLWNPEVILVNEMSAYHYIKGHPHWSSIKAVEDGKIYKLPQGISRWGHPGSVETPLALLWAVDTIYPEQAEEIDLKEEIRYFYDKFLSTDLTDDTIETILEGEEYRLPKGEE